MRQGMGDLSKIHYPLQKDNDIFNLIFEDKTAR